MAVNNTFLRRLSTADTNSALVKAGDGWVKGWILSNTNAAARYVKMYDKVTAPTVGTDTPKLTLLVPPNAVVFAELGAQGIPFSTGIGLGITTGVADADTGAVAANEVIVHLEYA